MENSIIIIGGGPGGYVAAIRAAKLGRKVILIEKDKLGGTCLNRGCVPTKALLHSTEYLNMNKEVSKYGIKVDIQNFRLEYFIENKNAVVYQLVKGVEKLIKRNKIEYFMGEGILLDKNTVRIKMTSGKVEEKNAKNIILATGSVCSKIPIPGYENDGVITSDDALKMEKIPKSIVIIGAGAVGIELSYIYSNLGAKVTIVEMMQNILPSVDIEISTELEKSLTSRGIILIKNAKVERINKESEHLEVVINSQGKKDYIQCEQVLMAIGRLAYTEELNIEGIGIKTEKGKICVNNKMETNIKGIYAIGDVIGGIQLAHVASAEAVVAVDNCYGRNKIMDYKVVPSCLYTIPEVASVGLTEKQAIEKKYNVKIGRFNIAGNAKAVATGVAEGMVKIITDEKYGEILGVHIIGERATDVIAEAAIAIQLEATVDELISTIHAHPTMTEIIFEAANDVYGMAIHK